MDVRQSRKRIAFVMPADSVYPREVLSGALDFARSRPDWTVRIIDEIGCADGSLNNGMSLSSFDGILGAFEQARHIADVMQVEIPVVNVVNGSRHLPLPFVDLDEEAVGRLAADYFIRSGLQHFAFIGQHDDDYSKQRGQSFRQHLESRGYSVSEIGCEAMNDTLIDFLRDLPKPVGCFCFRDRYAWWAANMASEIGLRIPEDIAILGAENHEFLCHLPQPPLSSIAFGARRVGFRGAQLLGKLMAQDPSADRAQLVEPEGLIERRSTRGAAVGDPVLRQAIAFIHEHSSEPIGVPDICRSVGISRRSLEYRFRRELDRSPGNELLQARLDNAKRLLNRSDLSIEQVARQSGFATAAYFATVFKKHVGSGPSRWRRQAAT